MHVASGQLYFASATILYTTPIPKVQYLLT